MAMIGIRMAAALAMTGLALSGCGEVAFKPGGSSEGFAAARQACHQQTTDDAAYRACLDKAGWSVADFGSTEPEPAADAAPSGASSPQTATGRAGSAATVSAAPVSATPETPARSTAPVAPSAPGPDPMSLVSVGSWWKFGSGEQDLHASVDQCVARLGPAHQPPAAVHTVTRALYACLAEHGWHGLGHAA
jgi:hypothetical protein